MHHQLWAWPAFRTPTPMVEGVARVWDGLIQYLRAWPGFRTATSVVEDVAQGLGRVNSVFEGVAMV